MSCRLEHASLTVIDMDAVVKFLCTAFPEFRVRGGGELAADGWTQRWLHVGTDTDYIALYQARPDATGRAAPHSVAPAANHLGFEVDSVDVIRERLSAAGYQEGFKAPDHPFRRRLYFIDPEGFEWEFVEYLSDDPAERNQY